MSNKGYGLVLIVLTAACSPYSLQQPSSAVKSSAPEAPTVFQRSAFLAFRETAAAISDSQFQGLGSASAPLGFALSEIFKQTCADQEGGAVIAIDSAFKSSFEMKTPKRIVKKEMFVDASVERSYILDKGNLECDRELPIIEVDLDKDLLQVKLEVKQRREENTFFFESKTETVEVEKPKSEKKPDAALPSDPSANTAGQATPAPQDKGVDPATSPTSTKEEAKTESVDVITRQMASVKSIIEGKRSVQFVERSEPAKDMVAYLKESKGQGTRVETVLATDGRDQTLRFTVDSQFKMLDTYSDESRDLGLGKGPLQKEIQTGLVKSVLAEGGSVETTITALKLEFPGGQCKAVSGKIQSKFFGKDPKQAEKVIDFDVASGSIAVTVLIEAKDQEGLDFETELLSGMDLQKEICSQDAFLD